MKNTMRTTQLALITVGLVAGVQGNAAFCDITFTGGNSVAAYGQVEVVNNLALDGFLTVNAGPNQGTYLLVPGPAGSVRLPDGTDLIYDNKVNLGSDPVLTGEGLAFVSRDSSGNPLVGFNLWGNSPGSYTLFGTPPWGQPNENGTANFTVVPESSNMFAGAFLLILLPFGASWVRNWRSRAA
jgi:hypothetical protein